VRGGGALAAGSFVRRDGNDGVPFRGTGASPVRRAGSR